MPKLVISILSYNGESYLPDCLQSLSGIDYPKNGYDVMILDNASSDTSVRFIKNNYPEYKLIESKVNTGFAGGHNIIWQKAKELKADYLVLLNQDTIVEPDFLSKLVGAAETDCTIAACQSLMMLWPKKDLINSAGNVLHYLGFGYVGGYLSPRSEWPVIPSSQLIDGYASGGCVLYKMSALEKVGLFDEAFFAYQEDLDLSWKLRLAGYKIALAPLSVIYHKYDFSRSVEKYYWLEKNRFIVFLTNYKLLTLFLMMPLACVAELGIFLFSIKSGFCIQKLRAYLFFLKPQSWNYLIKRRKFINSIRMTTDRKILSYMSDKMLFPDIQNPLLTYIFNPFCSVYLKLLKKIIWW